MKIIQSFSLDKNDKYKYSYFFTFLLSYLTLKDKYDNVTMYCNKYAYETFINFIPYDEIVLLEVKDIKKEALKINKNGFIYVNPGVIIFNKIFDDYIKGNKNLMFLDKYLINGVLCVDDNVFGVKNNVDFDNIPIKDFYTISDETKDITLIPLNTIDKKLTLLVKYNIYELYPSKYDYIDVYLDKIFNENIIINYKD